MSAIRRLTVFVLAMTLALLPACESEGGADPDAAAKQTLDGIAGQWQAESVPGILGYFPPGEGEKVYFGLGGDKSGSFSRKQAEGVLRRYFDEISVDRVVRRKWNGDSGATYIYEYHNASGQGVSGSLIIEVRQASRRWVLNSVQVN